MFVIQCRGRVVRTDEPNASTEPGDSRGVRCVINSSIRSQQLTGRRSMLKLFTDHDQAISELASPKYWP